MVEKDVKRGEESNQNFTSGMFVFFEERGRVRKKEEIMRSGVWFAEEEEGKSSDLLQAGADVEELSDSRSPSSPLFLFFFCPSLSAKR